MDVPFSPNSVDSPYSQSLKPILNQLCANLDQEGLSTDEYSFNTKSNLRISTPVHHAPNGFINEGTCKNNNDPNENLEIHTNSQFKVDTNFQGSNRKPKTQLNSLSNDIQPNFENVGSNILHIQSVSLSSYSQTNAQTRYQTQNAHPNFQTNINPRLQENGFIKHPDTFQHKPAINATSSNHSKLSLNGNINPPVNADINTLSNSEMDNLSSQINLLLNSYLKAPLESDMYSSSHILNQEPVITTSTMDGRLSSKKNVNSDTEIPTNLNANSAEKSTSCEISVDFLMKLNSLFNNKSSNFPTNMAKSQHYNNSITSRDGTFPIPSGSLKNNSANTRMNESLNSQICSDGWKAKSVKSREMPHSLSTNNISGNKPPKSKDVILSNTTTNGQNDPKTTNPLPSFSQLVKNINSKSGRRFNHRDTKTVEPDRNTFSNAVEGTETPNNLLTNSKPKINSNTQSDYIDKSHPNFMDPKTSLNIYLDPQSDVLENSLWSNIQPMGYSVEGTDDTLSHFETFSTNTNSSTSINSKGNTNNRLEQTLNSTLHQSTCSNFQVDGKLYALLSRASTNYPHAMEQNLQINTNTNCLPNRRLFKDLLSKVRESNTYPESTTGPNYTQNIRLDSPQSYLKPNANFAATNFEDPSFHPNVEEYTKEERLLATLDKLKTHSEIFKGSLIKDEVGQFSTSDTGPQTHININQFNLFVSNSTNLELPILDDSLITSEGTENCDFETSNLDLARESSVFIQQLESSRNPIYQKQRTFNITKNQKFEASRDIRTNFNINPNTVRINPSTETQGPQCGNPSLNSHVASNTHIYKIPSIEPDANWNPEVHVKNCDSSNTESNLKRKRIPNLIPISFSSPDNDDSLDSSSERQSGAQSDISKASKSNLMESSDSQAISSPSNAVPVNDSNAKISLNIKSTFEEVKKINTAPSEVPLDQNSNPTKITLHVDIPLGTTLNISSSRSETKNDTRPEISSYSSRANEDQQLRSQSTTVNSSEKVSYPSHFNTDEDSHSKENRCSVIKVISNRVLVPEAQSDPSNENICLNPVEANQYLPSSLISNSNFLYTTGSQPNSALHSYPYLISKLSEHQNSLSTSRIETNYLENNLKITEKLSKGLNDSRNRTQEDVGHLRNNFPERQPILTPQPKVFSWSFMTPEHVTENFESSHNESAHCQPSRCSVIQSVDNITPAISRIDEKLDLKMKNFLLKGKLTTVSDEESLKSEFTIPGNLNKLRRDDSNSKSQEDFNNGPHSCLKSSSSIHTDPKIISQMSSISSEMTEIKSEGSIASGLENQIDTKVPLTLDAIDALNPDVKTDFSIYANLILEKIIKDEMKIQENVENRLNGLKSNKKGRLNSEGNFPIKEVVDLTSSDDENKEEFPPDTKLKVRTRQKSFSKDTEDQLKHRVMQLGLMKKDEIRKFSSEEDFSGGKGESSPGKDTHQVKNIHEQSSCTVFDPKNDTKWIPPEHSVSTGKSNLNFSNFYSNTETNNKPTVQISKGGDNLNSEKPPESKEKLTMENVVDLTKDAETNSESINTSTNIMKDESKESRQELAIGNVVDLTEDFETDLDSENRLSCLDLVNRYLRGLSKRLQRNSRYRQNLAVVGDVVDLTEDFETNSDSVDSTALEKNEAHLKQAESLTEQPRKKRVNSIFSPDPNTDTDTDDILNGLFNTNDDSLANDAHVESRLEISNEDVESTFGRSSLISKDLILDSDPNISWKYSEINTVLMDETYGTNLTCTEDSPSNDDHHKNAELNSNQENFSQRDLELILNQCENTNYELKSQFELSKSKNATYLNFESKSNTPNINDSDHNVNSESQLITENGAGFIPYSNSNIEAADKLLSSLNADSFVESLQTSIDLAHEYIEDFNLDFDSNTSGDLLNSQDKDEHSDTIPRSQTTEDVDELAAHFGANIDELVNPFPKDLILDFDSEKLLIPRDGNDLSLDAESSTFLESCLEPTTALLDSQADSVTWNAMQHETKIIETSTTPPTSEIRQNLDAQPKGSTCTDLIFPPNADTHIENTYSGTDYSQYPKFDPNKYPDSQVISSHFYDVEFNPMETNLENVEAQENTRHPDTNSNSESDKSSLLVNYSYPLSVFSDFRSETYFESCSKYPEGFRDINLEGKTPNAASPCVQQNVYWNSDYDKSPYDGFNSISDSMINIFTDALSTICLTPAPNPSLDSALDTNSDSHENSCSDSNLHIDADTNASYIDLDFQHGENVNIPKETTKNKDSIGPTNTEDSKNQAISSRNSITQSKKDSGCMDTKSVVSKDNKESENLPTYLVPESSSQSSKPTLGKSPTKLTLADLCAEIGLNDDPDTEENTSPEVTLADFQITVHPDFHKNNDSHQKFLKSKSKKHSSHRKDLSKRRTNARIQEGSRSRNLSTVEPRSLQNILIAPMPIPCSIKTIKTTPGVSQNHQPRTVMVPGKNNVSETSQSSNGVNSKKLQTPSTKVQPFPSWNTAVSTQNHSNNSMNNIQKVNSSAVSKRKRTSPFDGSFKKPKEESKTYNIAEARQIALNNWHYTQTKKLRGAAAIRELTKKWEQKYKRKVEDITNNETVFKKPRVCNSEKKSSQWNIIQQLMEQQKQQTDLHEKTTEILKQLAEQQKQQNELQNKQTELIKNKGFCNLTNKEEQLSLETSPNSLVNEVSQSVTPSLTTLSQPSSILKFPVVKLGITVATLEDPSLHVSKSSEICNQIPANSTVTVLPSIKEPQSPASTLIRLPIKLASSPASKQHQGPVTSHVPILLVSGSPNPTMILPSATAFTTVPKSPVAHAMNPPVALNSKSKVTRSPVTKVRKSSATHDTNHPVTSHSKSKVIRPSSAKVSKSSVTHAINPPVTSHSKSKVIRPSCAKVPKSSVTHAVNPPVSLHSKSKVTRSPATISKSPVTRVTNPVTLHSKSKVIHSPVTSTSKISFEDAINPPVTSHSKFKVTHSSVKLHSKSKRSRSPVTAVPKSAKLSIPGIPQSSTSWTVDSSITKKGELKSYHIPRIPHVRVPSSRVTTSPLSPSVCMVSPLDRKLKPNNTKSQQLPRTNQVSLVKDGVMTKSNETNSEKTKSGLVENGVR